MRKATLGVLALWIGLFYLAPIATAILFSFLTPLTYGGVEWTPTLQGYAYAKPELFGRTALFALSTALVCTAVSLVVSIEALLRPSPAKNRFILGLAVFALVTNSLVKIYSWLLLLGASGPLASLQLSNETFRVMVGLIHMYLPFGLLLVFEGVRSIDPGLIRAARDLGASDRAIAWRILLPLARPFAISATFIVAVFVFAEFLVPQILGRGKLMLTGNRMSELFGAPHFNWPACMAIGSVVVLLLFAILSATALRRREA